MFANALRGDLSNSGGNPGSIKSGRGGSRSPDKKFQRVTKESREAADEEVALA
jgi:hypothetical protein